MELVNVYDFDKTILPYDSTEAFVKYCFKKYPRSLKPAAPALLRAPLLLRGPAGKTRMKEVLYRFLTAIPNIDEELELFWQENIGSINQWYINHRRPDDIVISASPEFLLRIPQETFGFRLIASRVDKYTGETMGLNNGGEEKVLRLRQAYPQVEINEFFSDSRRDEPLARLAKKAFMVEGERVFPWPWK